jgi:hypothetical protein
LRLKHILFKVEYTLEIRGDVPPTAGRGGPPENGDEKMTASPAWTEQDRPGHDPVAEDMDLLTHQEAAARFFDEIEALRTEEAGLGAQGGDAERLAAVRSRIAVLHAAIERIRQRRTPTY